MVDFISEVQEELRKDDYNLWLRKYGPYVAALIVLIVAFTGYLQWKEYNAERVSENTSYDFIEVVENIDQDKSTAAAQFVKLSDTAPSGYAGISLLRAAELELNNGNTDQAVALLDQAAQTFTRRRHADLAKLKAGYILADQGDYDAVIARMEPLTANNAPYQYLARELLAFGAKQSGDIQSARKHYSFIETNPGAPETIVRRAQQNLILLNQTQTQPTETEPVPEITPPTETEEQ